MKDDKDGSVTIYKKALKLNPLFAEAYAGLGLAYRDLGNSLGAVESFHAALDLQPDHPLATEMQSFIAAQRRTLLQDPPIVAAQPKQAP